MTTLIGPIQLRRGTASEWTTANTVLLSGEKGVETDTGLEKVGDGTTAWNDLPYQFAAATDADDHPAVYAGTDTYGGIHLYGPDGSEL